MEVTEGFKDFLRHKGYSEKAIKQMVYTINGSGLLDLLEEKGEKDNGS